MRIFSFWMVILSAWLLLPDGYPASSLYAGEQRFNPASEGMPVYNSPVKDANIRRRVGGEENAQSNRGLTRGITRGLTRGLTRSGANAELPSRMSPLAPESVGLTSKKQPVVGWYVSGPWTGKIEFVITDTQARRDVLKTHIDGPSGEGVYLISFADHGVTLRPDVRYGWSLAIVPDEKERSADFVAIAVIRYAEPSISLSKRLAETPEERRYNVYAREGYWHDAIEHLSRLIDARPGDKRLRCHRAALLRQVNLPIAAKYDCE